ncbi:MAG TPA: TorF family putative porin [Sphingomonas sp.]
MRKALLTSILLAGSALVASPAFADDTPAAAPAPTSAFTITGAADVSSQYRFRGISQSDNKPVFQGTFTIAHSSGFYLSTWGSSATANNAVNIGGTEIDVYGGYSKTISGITLDGGLYGYIYPGATAGNYFEVYGDVSKAFGPVTAKAGVNWAPKQHNLEALGGTKYNVYVFGELGLAVPNFPITFHSHVGHTAGAFDFVTNGGVEDYIDYTVGASYKWKALTFDISYVGTNISKDDTSLIDNDFHRVAKGVVVGTITASF